MNWIGYHTVHQKFIFGQQTEKETNTKIEKKIKYSDSPGLSLSSVSDSPSEKGSG